jgi:hypothetical protein
MVDFDAGFNAGIAKNYVEQLRYLKCCCFNRMAYFSLINTSDNGGKLLNLSDNVIADKSVGHWFGYDHIDLSHK